MALYDFLSLSLRNLGFPLLLQHLRLLRNRIISPIEGLLPLGALPVSPKPLAPLPIPSLIAFARLLAALLLLFGVVVLSLRVEVDFLAFVLPILDDVDDPAGEILGQLVVAAVGVGLHVCGGRSTSGLPLEVYKYMFLVC
jgi:hypothetical protein